MDALLLMVSYDKSELVEGQIRPNKGITFIFPEYIHESGWDSMSVNSNYSSVSSQSLFGKMKSNRPAPLQESAPKKTFTNAEYSKGIRQVNKSGYEVYNVDNSGEIFIAKAPESAFFNDGEDLIVKAESGKMVGLYRPKADVKIETVEPKKNNVPVNMMFLSVKRGSDLKVDTFTGTYTNGVLKKAAKETQ